MFNGKLEQGIQATLCKSFTVKPGKYGAAICGRVKVGKGSYILGGGSGTVENLECL